MEISADTVDTHTRHLVANFLISRATVRRPATTTTRRGEARRRVASMRRFECHSPLRALGGCCLSARLHVAALAVCGLVLVVQLRSFGTRISEPGLDEESMLSQDDDPELVTALAESATEAAAADASNLAQALDASMAVA